MRNILGNQCGKFTHPTHIHSRLRFGTKSMHLEPSYLSVPFKQTVLAAILKTDTLRKPLEPAKCPSNTMC
eukprot:6031676-Amphidinium_carterae.1